jgi:hypothetical protein
MKLAIRAIDMHKSGRAGQARRVFDRTTIASLVQGVVDKRFRGNQSEAARSIGLHPSQLSRLVTKKAAALRPRTLTAIEDLLPRRLHAMLHAALSSEAVEDLLTRGEQWREWAHSTRHLTRRAAPHPFESPAAQNAREQRRQLRFLALRLTWEDEQPAASNRLAAVAKEWGHDQERLRWAWERMLEPLLDAEDTGYLERAWEELSKDEQRKFAEASVTRECILLRRLPEPQRAQEVSAPAWRRRLREREVWPTEPPELAEV